MADTITGLDIQQIKELLPHRYPFLLVDRITYIEPGVRITGVKNVTINEPFFQGHFPREPIMPGVLILEALAQTGIIFAKITDKKIKEELIVFAGMDRVRFRSPVLPGDQLLLQLAHKKRKRNLWKMDAKALVDEKVVAEAELIAAVA